MCYTNGASDEPTPPEIADEPVATYDIVINLQLIDGYSLGAPGFGVE